MTQLLNRLNQDLIIAQKAKDEVRISALRLVLAEIKNAQIAKGAELLDEEIVAAIQKDAKRHKESIEAFEGAGRGELASKESRELEILQAYLPSQLTEKEIGQIVGEVIAQSGASSFADMGKVMGQVMARVGGGADGAQVAKVVGQKLGRK